MKSEVGTVFTKLVIFHKSTGDLSDGHPSNYQPRPTGHYFGHSGPLTMLRWTDGNRCFSVMQALVRLPPCFISITSANAKHIYLCVLQTYISSLLMSRSHFIFSILLKWRCWIVRSCLSSVFLCPSKFVQKLHISSSNKHENWVHCLKWFT